MKRQDAIDIHNAGQKVVVDTLRNMSGEITRLKKEVKSKDKEITRLKKEVKSKDKEIARLKKEANSKDMKIARLSKNSTNSSKKPSSDDVTKPKPKKKGGKKRKPGGQPGHPMHERPLFSKEEIDHHYEYKLEECPLCGDDAVFIDFEPRSIQQIEIKDIIFEKYEHLTYPIWCESCQKVHYAPFPPEVAKERFFKARTTATVAYMSKVCHASFSTMRKFFRDIIGIPISRGYLAKIISKVSLALEKPYEELLNRLPLESRVNVDETGHKENGDRFWTWVFKADLYVLFKIDKSRGSKVLIDVLGEEFDGVLGSDYFSAYRKFMREFNVSIQFCIAHLIRDIKFLTGLPDKETKKYGKKLLKNVKELFKVIHDNESLTEEDFISKLNKAKEAILKTAIEDAPILKDEKGKEQKGPVKNMADRFRKHGEAYFTFITTPGMEPTNNCAEQAIRFIVIDRHITQGTRSIKGRTASERLWSVIATCELQGRSAFEFILKAVEAHFNELPSPSLLPDPADTS